MLGAVTIIQCIISVPNFACLLTSLNN